MCGIFGILSKDQKPVEENLTSIDKTLSTRGPDKSSSLSGNHFFLHHRRLSIRDVSENGTQPMVSSSGRFVICFNGEIYNSEILRPKLTSLGKVFRGFSDTEVLLEYLEAFGVDKTLKDINGMFAFCAIDLAENVAIIARDHVGIKPLFVSVANAKIIFSSDIRAISKSSNFQGEISPIGLNKFIRNGYIKGPDTIHEGIQKLKPGTYLKIDLPSMRKEQVEYWSLQEKFGEVDRFSDFDYCKNSLKEMLRDTVKMQMISDVPLGIFLSGGIDSSLLTAIAHENSKNKIDTFTIGFHDKKFNEAVFAKKIAAHIGTSHHEMYLGDQDFLSVVEDLPRIYSEPFADASQIPTILVSRLARKNVTVALGGDGGDELFLGYNRYLFVSKLFEKINRYPSWSKRFCQNGIGIMPDAFFEIANELSGLLTKNKVKVNNPSFKFRKLATLLDSKNLADFYNKVTSQIFYPEIFLSEKFKTKIPEVKLESFNFNRSSAEVLSYYDMMEYLVDDILVKTDKASMSASLEARVPFLDHNVVEFSTRVPFEYKIKDGKGKFILREILADYIPRELYEREKMGFSVPLDSWMRSALRDLLIDELSPSVIKRQGYLDSDMIQKVIHDHLSGKADLGYQLWNILMFQMWLREESR